MKVIFGDSWYYSQRFARVANRAGGKPDYRDDSLGLRLARTPVQRMRR